MPTITKTKGTLATAIPDNSAGAPQIGTNMGTLVYYSDSAPLLDITRNAEIWVPSNTTVAVPYNANKYPTSLPSGVTVVVNFLYNAGPAMPPNTEYVFTYEGEGTFAFQHGVTVLDHVPGRMTFRTGSGGIVQLRISATDPNGTGNYLRNFHCVRADLYQSWLDGNVILNPPVFERVRGFTVLRFMDYMQANATYDPRTGKNVGSYTAFDTLPELEWADRPNKPDSLLWAYYGVPVEFLVDMCNRLNVNPWFCLPIHASDDYMLKFGEYVRDNLNPHLVARIELSNEVWNDGFMQKSYARRKALALWGINWRHMEWLGMRTAQMSQIIRPLFSAAPERIRIVAGTQWGSAGGETLLLTTPDWKDANGNTIRAADFIDELAVAPYFYASMAKNYYDTVKRWWQTEPDGGVTKAFDLLWEDFNSYNADRHKYFGDKATQYGLEYVTYEAGYHEVSGDRSGDAAFTAFLNDLPRYSEMGKIEEANVRNFRAAGGKLFTNYQLFSAPSEYGSWGLYENLNQNSSPRLRALKSYMPLDER